MRITYMEGMGIKVLDSVSLREYLVRTSQCSSLPTVGT